MNCNVDVGNAKTQKNLHEFADSEKLKDLKVKNKEITDKNEDSEDEWSKEADICHSSNKVMLITKCSHTTRKHYAKVNYIILIV
jgi:hypothetical protein